MHHHWGAFELRSAIQETFKDSRGIWMEHEDDSPRQTIAKIWRNVCGEQELSTFEHLRADVLRLT